MKRTSILLLAFAAVIMTSLNAFAQIPSPLKDIVISANVVLDNSMTYKYDYIISNPATNTSQIIIVRIDISKPVQSQYLPYKGLIIQKGVNPRGMELSRTFDEETARKGLLMQKPVIPVGTQVPPGWSSSIAVMGDVMWGGSEKNVVQPGLSLAGFAIISYGLPGIRDAFVEPDVDVDQLPDEYTENVELTIQLKNSLMFQTKTIGPTAPPADFKPIDFLDYIIDLKHQSASLGWITNAGVENSLDAKLNNAKKKMVDGDLATVKNILNAFINEVDAQRGKKLSSEAYALLRYNAQFLIEKLQ